MSVNAIVKKSSRRGELEKVESPPLMNKIVYFTAHSSQKIVQLWRSASFFSFSSIFHAYAIPFGSTSEIFSTLAILTVFAMLNCCSASIYSNQGLILNMTLRIEIEHLSN
jgi:hypothetical protein